MTIRRVTPPATEPVTLDEAKDHLRLETGLDDAYVTKLIKRARELLEKLCWRAFLLQTWELTLPGFRGGDRLEMAPDWVSPVPGFIDNWLGSTATSAFRFNPYLELPRGHLATAPNVAIVYLDENGTQQTLSSSAYLVEGAGADADLGRIWLNDAGGFQWPNTLRQFNAVKVTYTVGWDSADAMPEPLRQAVLVVLAQLYEHRTPEIESRLSESEFTSDVLISPYRFNRI
jgi:hypothetical protein